MSGCYGQMMRISFIPSAFLVLASLLSRGSCVHAQVRGAFTPIEEEVSPGLLEGGLKRYPREGQLRSLGKPLHLAIVWDVPVSLHHVLDHRLSPRSWARCYAMKDYYDTVRPLLRYPEIRCTINLPPRLLNQLQEIADEDAKREPVDELLDLTLKPAAELTEEDKEQLLVRFFPASWREVAYPHPRYKELDRMRVRKRDGYIDIPGTVQKYTTQEYLDLQVWFNLSTFHPDFQWGEVQLPSGDTVTVKPLVDKGRDFTEEEKLELVDARFRLLRSVISTYKVLQEQGRIEVITSPLHNPVLPLLCDTDVAKIPAPGTAPLKRYSYPEDAASQIELAAGVYRESLGKPLRGILPAGGAVSAELIPLVARCGVKWCPSGEMVLARSLGKDFLAPHEICHPYAGEKGGKELMIVFRDDQLHKVILSRYPALSGVRAAKDLLMRLYEIHAQSATFEEPPIVLLILPTHRLWPHSEENGKDFLYFLYSQISQMDWLRTVTVEQYLAQFPPKRAIETLQAGSWVEGGFSLWIGEKEQNLAWKYLLEARETAEQAKGKVSGEKMELAMQEIYSAQGSHWFRSLGDYLNAPDDGHLSDQAFRRALRCAYLFLGFRPPDYLEESILPGVSETPTLPQRLRFAVQDPELDDYGPGTYTYPTDETFSPGVLDLLRFEVLTNQDLVLFRLKFRELTNPWRAPLGFSHQLINIYLSTGMTEEKPTKFRRNGANVRFDPKIPWDFMVKVAGWPGYGRIVYSNTGEPIGECEVSCDLTQKTVSISVSKALIGDPDGAEWAYYVLIGSQDGFGPDNYRPVEEEASQWQGGGNFKGSGAPRVYDMLDPAFNGKTQEEMLSSYNPEKEKLALIFPVTPR